MEQAARHGEILFDVQAADVVGLPDSAPLENGQNTPAIILCMQPLALLSSVTVDRERLAVQGIGNHQWQELLRKLTGAIVVRRAGDDGRESIRPNVRTNEKVRACLRRRVTAAGLQR